MSTYFNDSFNDCCKEWYEPKFMKGRFHIVEWLLDESNHQGKRVEIDAVDNSSMTALFHAASQGDARIVTLLLEKRAKKIVGNLSVLDFTKKYKKTLNSDLLKSYPVVRKARKVEYHEMMKSLKYKRRTLN